MVRTHPPGTWRKRPEGFGQFQGRVFCSSCGRIWSGPGALSGFKPCSNLMMPLNENFSYGIFGCLFLVSSGGCDIFWL